MIFKAKILAAINMNFEVHTSEFADRTVARVEALQDGNFGNPYNGF